MLIDKQQTTPKYKSNENIFTMASHLHARRKPHSQDQQQPHNVHLRQSPNSEGSDKLHLHASSSFGSSLSTPAKRQRRLRIISIGLVLLFSTALVITHCLLSSRKSHHNGDRFFYAQPSSTRLSEEVLQPPPPSSESSSSSPCPFQQTDFRVNNLLNPFPLALPDAKPVFSWALVPTTKKSSQNHYQTAYRIVCATVQDNEENVLWDTGKIVSRETLQIEYAGLPLTSLQRVQWNVTVWDEHDNECFQEQDNWFETGLLDEAAWQDAQWLARDNPNEKSRNATDDMMCQMMEASDENQAPRFRTTVTLPNPVTENIASIRAYVTGLGYYQLYINGQRVGDSLLDPGWTTYSKRMFYSTYDVTSLFHEAEEHVIAVELGNGWWNPLPFLLWESPDMNLRKNLVQEQGFTTSTPMFRLQVFVFYTDGRVESLVKSSADNEDDTEKHHEWLASGSPTTFNNIFLGEKYDARLESLYHQWNAREYDATLLEQNWKPAVMANATGLGRLEAQAIPPIRRQETHTTTLLSQQPLLVNNTTTDMQMLVLDTGVNHAGSCRIQLQGDYPQLEGHEIHLLYGELLWKNGTVNGRTAVVGQIKKHNPLASPCQPEIAYQTDVVTLGAATNLDWTPSWSWHGFRYVEVVLPAIIRPEDFHLECFTMRTDVDAISHFSSSDPYLTNLRTLVRNTLDSNMMSVLSDCPHRERFGYGGDALAAGEAAMSIYDFSAFFRKRIHDFNDAQRTISNEDDRDNPNNKLTGFTETTPYVGIADKGLGPGTGPIGWQTFQPEAQLWLYKYYGDVKTMRESFPHTQAYIDLLDSANTSLIEGGLGDWMPTDETDVAFTGLGFQRMSYLAFSNITEILGMSPDIAVRYRQKAADLTHQINERFLVGRSSSMLDRIKSYLNLQFFRGGGQMGDYLVGTENRTGNITQTGQAMALFNGHLESDQDLKRHALLRMVQNTHQSTFIRGAGQCKDESPFQPQCGEEKGGPGPHMTTGMFGIKWYLMALADGGMNDLAYEVVTTKSYPSLGWMMNNPFTNATTIWESFYFSDDMYSHNHPMFGSIETWLIQSVAGIQQHPDARGMDRILIRPNPPSQLLNAEARFRSHRGMIASSWKKEGSTNNAFTLTVTIPPNCRATVHVPSSRATRVIHNEQDVTATSRWVPSLASPDRGAFVSDIGSGVHEFKSELDGSDGISIQ